MKNRRALSTFILLALMLVVLPAVTKSAEDATTFSALQREINNAASGGTIQLEKDCIYDATSDDKKWWNYYSQSGILDYHGALRIPAGKSLTIDLNGHSIDRALAGQSAVDCGYVILVEGALTLLDSAGGGAITGGNTDGGSYGGGIHINAKGSLTMAGGSITGNCVADLGGGVFVASGGKLTLRGGTITGNRAENGGGVYAEGSTQQPACEISGSPIVRGNRNGSGAEDNVSLVYSVITISGGLGDSADLVISRINGAPPAAGAAIAASGGGYALTAADAARLHTADGTLIGCPDGDGGATLASTYTVAFCDGATLLGSQRVAPGGTIQPPAAPSTPAGGPENGGYLFRGWYAEGAAEPWDFEAPLRSDITLYARWETAWSALGEQLSQAESGTTVRLARSYTALDGDESLLIPEGRSVTLDLDGFTLDANGRDRVFTVGGSLTLTDSAGGGMLTGGSAELGGGIYIASGGTLILCGGAICGNRAALRGGGVYAAGGAALDLSGCAEITGNLAGDLPGNVYLSSGVLVTIASQPANASPIGVTTERAPAAGAPVPIAEAGPGYALAPADRKCFAPDAEALAIGFDGGRLALGTAVYAVSFATGGELPAPAAQAVVSSGKAVAPADPARDGFAFAGWYDGATRFDFASDVTSDLTLSASWRTILTDETVSVDAAAFTGSAQRPVVRCGGAALREDVAYTVSGADACAEPGSYAVTISGIGAYTGTVEKSFSITLTPSLAGGCVTAPAGARLLLAAYDGGRMTDVQSVTLERSCADASPAGLGLAPPKAGSYRLMLIDGKTCVPLCEAWFVGDVSASAE